MGEMFVFSEVVRVLNQEKDGCVLYTYEDVAEASEVNVWL